MTDLIQGKQYGRLVIREAMLINGKGTPPFGPVDIVIEKDKITEIVNVDEISLNRYPNDWERPEGDQIIEATSMYVIPGLVDMHVHVPFDPNIAGPKGFEYCYKLFLAHGVTTIRTCGFGTDEKLVEHRQQSKENKIIAPRLVVLGSWPAAVKTPEDARKAVHKLHSLGVNGIKIIPRPHVTKEMMQVIGNEVRKLKMNSGIAIHIPQSSELDAVIVSNAAKDHISIEHTYGIPQAALPGIQRFPPDYNYSDELDRFRWSGYIWNEAEKYPVKVKEIFDTLIENGTVWDPTMVVYEGHCDIERIQTKKWHETYTVPQLMNYWSPSPGRHATHFFEWKTSDEIAWKKKYRVWQKYVKYFFDNGGKLTVGSDVAFIYALYGFSTIRELELMQQAGIHPVDVIKIATTNAHKFLGLSDLSNGVSPDAKADLVIIDGNPIDNFKVMYGTGLLKYSIDKKNVHRAGGVRYTIKGGVVYDAYSLLQDVKNYVIEEKA